MALHLSELVRMAFMAATSESDPLRLEGLKTLEVKHDMCFYKLNMYYKRSLNKSPLLYYQILYM